MRVVAKERQVPVALGGANQIESDAQGCARVIVLCSLQVHDMYEQHVCFIRSQSGEFQNLSNVGNAHGYWPPELYPSNPRNPAFLREPAETGQFTRAPCELSAPRVSRCSPTVIVLLQNPIGVMKWGLNRGAQRGALGFATYVILFLSVYFFSLTPYLDYALCPFLTPSLCHTPKLWK